MVPTRQLHDLIQVRHRYSDNKIQTRRPLGGAIPRKDAFGSITPTPNLPQSKTCTHLFTGVCCIFWHRPRPFASIIFFRKIAKTAKQFFPYSSHISWPIDTKLCTRYLQTHTQRMHETLFWCDLWRRNGSVLNIGLLAKLDVEYQKSKEIQN